MPRSLSLGQMIGAESVAGQVVQLLEFGYWDGVAEQVLRLSSIAVDLTASIDGSDEVFVGAGAFLSYGAVTETDDWKAQAVDVQLSGVDGSIISVIMGNEFRGRPFRMWRAWIDPDTGLYRDSPIMLFTGLLSDDLRMDTDVPDGQGPASIRVRTRIISSLANLRPNPVYTNVESHRAMLVRAGVTGGAIADTFFSKIPDQQGKPVRWGANND